MSEYSNEMDIWKAKINLYHLIQKHCDRPAYFWYNYREVVASSKTGLVPLEGLSITHRIEWLPLSTEEQIGTAIKSGLLNPQEWCDTH